VIGQDSQKTRVYYAVASKDVNGMTERNCMLIDSTATDFTLENMTVENSYNYTNQSNEQADALCVLADRAIFSNVRLVGYQDTLLTDSKSSSVITRQYFYKCYITGNVDFIYGRGRSYFEDCDIVGRYTQYKKDGCFTAPRTESASAYGYVFNNCTALVNVDLPRVTRVSAYVFAGCTALKRLVMPSTSIFGPLTCKGCTSLELADLGTAENIYPNSFDDCTALTALIFRTHKVCMTTQNQTFSNNPIAGGTGYIYVPADQVEAYRASEFWSAFAGQIRAIEDYPGICGAEGGAAA
jgi:hypothetical protein